MLHRFDFTSYQPKIVDHIKAHEGCACWVPMGYGKTVSALTAFADVGGKALVVAPLRVARDVWIDEVQAWSHLQGITTSRIMGSEAERRAGLEAPADIHLINRENLVWLHDLFIEERAPYKYKQIRPWPWDWLFLDESQSYKSQSTKRYKAARRIRQFFEPRLVELTGMLTPNGYADLWSQMYLIDGGQRLGRTEEAYQQRWFDPPGEYEYGITIKPHAPAEIQALIADVVISIENVDPPVPINQIRVKLPESVLAQYRKFERTSVLKLGGSTITAANAGVLNGRLLQAANGAIYTGNDRDYQVFHSAKVDALAEVLEGLREPALVSYAFQHDLARIAAVLDRHCGKKKIWRLLKSEASMKEFRSGLVSYGVVHPGSAGHGLNDLYLSGASDLVWFGLTNNLEHFDQLNARIIGGHRRTGRNVMLHAIMADGTIDAEMLDLLMNKRESDVGLARAIARRHA